VINGFASSDWSPVSSGVPHSILGPLLFILYINDLSSATNSAMKIFADDIALYHSVDFNILITDWCSKWQMCLNPSTSVNCCAY